MSARAFVTGVARGAVIAWAFLLVVFLGVIAVQVDTIADRLDTATIGGTRVPAVECAEDEVIAWLGPDSLGCVHYENVAD